MWLRLRNIEKKKRCLSFPPPWEFQTPISSSGTPDFLSTCLGIDSLSSACAKRPEEASPERQCRDWDRGWGVTTSGYSGSFWDDGNVLWLDGGAGCTTLWRYWMPLNCNFKMTDFTLHELFLFFFFCCTAQLAERPFLNQGWNPGHCSESTQP